ncbi:hypothetical protein C6502_07975 [Candidatus Poribacteria bacterium]|nr:MAG: hypothetical protein C6502_07975 [Candidatus Poribacteria bacterium]
MASYDEWNKAIVEYFVSGLSSGATVYLSVDEETLMHIGSRFEQSETSDVDWVEDFIEAVRSECVIGNQVYLEEISDYQSDKIPRCVAFLAAMVLAAHQMVAEETKEIVIAQINYFTRLRQVLGLSPEKGGRPDGLLPAGIEEPLWKTWEWWLIRNGWLPSAERGEGVTYAYINYPLSQALLRKGDKETLERLFRERENLGALSRVWDRDIVGLWVRRQQFNSKYLTELIQESDFRRHEVITNALHDVYISIDWEQEMLETQSGVRSIVQRRLTAQLYREEEDFITGNINYYLYPQQPKHFSDGALEVIRNGRTHPLNKDRPGWFRPLWSENPAGGLSYEVKGHPQIKELILPERQFWILVRDPEDEMSGVFAGWKHPGLGETFLLLCRKDYAEQMELFRQEDLLRWHHDFSINDEWVEYRECMIVSPSWEGIIPQYQDLYNALKPTISATISLRGGLRVPNQGGWLEGYPPEMTIIAFDDNVELKLLDKSDPDTPDTAIMDQTVDTNKPMGLPVLDPGNYLLEVHNLGKPITQRVLQVLSWDSLDCKKPEQPFSIDAGVFTLQGAIIRVNEEV